MDCINLSQSTAYKLLSSERLSRYLFYRKFSDELFKRVASVAIHKGKIKILTCPNFA